jgi:hypothetical protein
VEHWLGTHLLIQLPALPAIDKHSSLFVRNEITKNILRGLAPNVRIFFDRIGSKKTSFFIINLKQQKQQQQ